MDLDDEVHADTRHAFMSNAVGTANITEEYGKYKYCIPRIEPVRRTPLYQEE